MRFKAITDPRDRGGGEMHIPFRLEYASRQAVREWERHVSAQPWARYRPQNLMLKDKAIATAQFLPRGVLVRVETTEKERASVLQHYLEPLRTEVPVPSRLQREGIPEPIRDAIAQWQERLSVRSELRGTYYRDYVRFATALTPRFQLDLYKYLDDFGRRWINEATQEAPDTTWDVEEPLPESIQQAVEEVRDFFLNHLYYVSALRIEPRVLWNISAGRSWGPVGIHGERVAQALHEWDQRLISYWDPVEEREVERSFGVALQRWLGHLELIDGVSANDMGKLGYRLEVADTEVRRNLDLTSVGLGVSQVLPILMTGLLMESGSTLLVEQPEVHLHPRAQSRLGDFFLSLARIGRQVIVETHSEHISNRVFRRIAESSPKLADMRDQVRVYFAERQHGETRIRKVTPNQYGIVEDWPVGFFDESALEAQAILEAGMRKRLKLAF